MRATKQDLRATLAGNAALLPRDVRASILAPVRSAKRALDARPTRAAERRYYAALRYAAVAARVAREEGI